MTKSNENKQIVVGSVVQLKSGSPLMTVIHIGGKRESDAVCEWFDMKFKKRAFPIAALVRVEKHCAVAARDRYFYNADLLNARSSLLTHVADTLSEEIDELFAAFLNGADDENAQDPEDLN